MEPILVNYEDFPESIEEIGVLSENAKGWRKEINRIFNTRKDYMRVMRKFI